MNRTKLISLTFVFYVLFVLFFFSPAVAQEKKNIRIVFVSLSWNNQLPIRVAMRASVAGNPRYACVAADGVDTRPAMNRRCNNTREVISYAHQRTTRPH